MKSYMKLLTAIALAVVALGGCVVVPVDHGYRGEPYYHNYYHDGDRYDGYYRDDRYHDHG
jgi:hypothetical protein